MRSRFRNNASKGLNSIGSRERPTNGFAYGCRLGGRRLYAQLPQHHLLFDRMKHSSTVQKVSFGSRQMVRLHKRIFRTVFR